MSEFNQKPDANDVLATSQADLKENFQFLNTILSRDHFCVFDVDTSADATLGRHKQVAFVNKGSTSPQTVPAGTNAMLYSFANDLWWNGGSPVQSSQLTNFNARPSITGTEGYTFLPGGLMLAYGTTAAPAQDTSIAFPNGGFTGVPLSFTFSYEFGSVATTPPTAVFVLNGTLTAAGVTVRKTGAGGSTFTSATPIYWMAIGLK